MLEVIIQLLSFMFIVICLPLYIYFERQIFKVLDDYSEFLIDKSGNSDEDSQVDE